MKTIFISYSHDSDAHAAKVLSFANHLIGMGGLDVILDQYNPDPAEGWPRWMDFELGRADFVLMVCTETYFRRVILKEDPKKGFGVTWEGNLIYNHFYKGKTLNEKFKPILFADGNEDHIPTPFKGKTNYRVDSADGLALLYRALVGRPLVIKPEPREEETAMSPKVVPLFQSTGSQIPKPENTPPAILSINNLPSSTSKLFGREEDLAQLDAAWYDPGVRVMVYVAQGGEGKTALLSEFLHRRNQNGWGGAVNVFVWSFYSQGSAQDRQASGTDFIRHFLIELGEEETAMDTSLQDFSKVPFILKHLRQSPTLLILDGMEPLQEPPGHPYAGELKDKAIRKLLKEFAMQGQGLCVVSTRMSLEDLKGSHGRGVVERSLEQLDEGAGAELLAALGVKGSMAEMKKAAKDCDGHALSLTLLGTLLVRAYGADVRKRDTIPNLLVERQLGKRAEHILRDYERCLEDLAALQVLRILGLFDRPIEMSVVLALASGDLIAGITDRLVGLRDADWCEALADLEGLRLIHKAVEGELPMDPGRKLDCHPLIREYFARQLSTQQPEAWQAAHLRLYEYYKSLPAKHQPDTLEEMEPLYRAMGHGCKAGRYQEVHDEVYQERIDRGNEDYATSRLGAFSSSLAAISGQFVQPWRVVRPELHEDSRAFLLNEAGFCLRALSRLREAIEPMEASYFVDIARKDSKGAAISAANLSELRLTLGDVVKAVEDGHAGVRHADDSKDWFQKMSKRTTLSDALHQAGRMQEAEALFREAEALQVQSQPQYPILYSLAGYRFCNLLLWKGEWWEVKKRAERTFEWAQNHGSLLTIALDHLSLGSATHLQALAEGSADFGEAKTHLDLAVEGLRKSGNMDDLPRGLLARAALYRSLKDHPAAERDLAEVLDIAENGEMRLYLTDYHLESARLRLAMGKPAEAIPHCEAAKQLIAETGYHRRDGELEELRVALGM